MCRRQPPCVVNVSCCTRHHCALCLRTLVTQPTLLMFGARRRAMSAGVCASRSGGGASDSNTLPEYSPRSASLGAGLPARAGCWLPPPRAAAACAAAPRRARLRRMHSRAAAPRLRRGSYAAAASATQGESIVMPVVMLKRASPVQSCKPYIRFAIAPRINQGEANSLIG